MFLLRVVLCGPYPDIGQYGHGGVETVIKNLKEGFEKYAEHVSIEILSKSKNVDGSIKRFNDVIYIKQPTFGLGSIFLSSYPGRIKNFLSKAKFDVINAHSIDFGYYGLDFKDKMLFTLHGVTWEEKKFLPKYQRYGWEFFYVKRLKNILKDIKYFVSINPYVTDIIKDKTNAEVFDIQNPVPDELFKICNDYDEKRAFYIGVISKRKNIMPLIKAMNIVIKEIKDSKLILSGKIIDKNYYNEIMDYISKNNLNNHIEYLGKITDNEKYQEFSKMRFLILTSLQETAPMVISEAFAAGKPVIASNICGIPNMIDDGENGILIGPENEKEIADAMIYLMENQDIAKVMGDKGKKYAEKYHSIKKIVEKYKNVYEYIENNR